MRPIPAPQVLLPKGETRVPRRGTWWMRVRMVWRGVAGCKGWAWGRRVIPRGVRPRPDTQDASSLPGRRLTRAGTPRLPTPEDAGRAPGRRGADNPEPHAPHGDVDGARRNATSSPHETTRLAHGRHHVRGPKT